MKVGFVGLGQQGKGLAINTVAAGFDVAVFDLNVAPRQELATHGATAASAAAEVARGAKVIQVCVLNDAQLSDVIAGPAGLVHSVEPDTVIAVHSTVRPDTIAHLAALVQAKGAELIDAPVSGGAAGAQARRMSFMVGGSEAALDVCRPVFAASGSRIVHTGALGSGIKAKLAHQVIIAINLMAAYEGMRLGTALGVPAAMLEQVVRDGAAQSMVANQWSQLFIGPQAPAVFYKDLQLCIEVGHSVGLSMPGSALCQQLLDTILADHLTPGEKNAP